MYSCIGDRVDSALWRTCVALCMLLYPSFLYSCLAGRFTASTVSHTFSKPHPRAMSSRPLTTRAPSPRRRAGRATTRLLMTGCQAPDVLPGGALSDARETSGTPLRKGVTPIAPPEERGGAGQGVRWSRSVTCVELVGCEFGWGGCGAIYDGGTCCRARMQKKSHRSSGSAWHAPAVSSPPSPLIPTIAPCGNRSPFPNRARRSLA